MEAPYDPMEPWANYAHATWSEVAELIGRFWSAGTEPGQQEVIDGLLDAIEHLDLAPARWRARVVGSTPTATPPVAAEVTAPPAETAFVEPASSDLAPALDEALAAAELTAVDGQQRAIDFAAHSYEALLDLRLLVRDALAATPAGSPLRHVEVWRWRPESMGPLTAAGREHGVELRLSRHAKPLYQ